MEKVNKKHKYSTWLLMIVGVFLFFAWVMAWDTGTVDLLCNDEGSMLIRLDGVWQCTTDKYVREDFRFPVEVIRQGAAVSQPQYTSFIGQTEVLTFDSTTLQEGFISIQMPHARVENSTLKPHWHWSPSTTDTGDIVWCVEYTCANIEDNFTSTEFQCIIDSSDGIVYKHQMTDMINITNTLESSAMCMMRIYRNASDIRDTFTGDAYLLEFDIHYTAQAVGEVYP